MDGDDVNNYLKEFSGLQITAKDFRTWQATVFAAFALAVSRPATHGPPEQAVLHMFQTYESRVGPLEPTARK
ncbi:hypothetical protein [Streptomyces sp. MBT49]|uniref:hypothetical protein n=1 Tax=Streptomyces sp. MBT49 TaxID=1488380 RepID=UPI0027DBA1A1|nr:hypothetical protein [Streptomyces sp. MBT49]